MKKYNLKELTSILKGKTEDEIDSDVLLFLQSSPLKGAQKLLATLKRNTLKKQQEQDRLKNLYKLEKEFWQQGQIVAGIDEAGRGPLAGPVVAGIVILDKENPFYPELKDSKKLKEAKREYLFFELTSTVKAWAVGIATNREIDKYNILNATKLAMKRALKKLKISPDVVLIDAVHLDNIQPSQFSFPKGEDKSASIAAASIIAKVYRDRLMVEKYHKKYPQYNFALHKGYGTAEHLAKLKYYGPCKIHRLTFKRVLTDDLKDFSARVISFMKRMVGASNLEELENIKVAYEKEKSIMTEKEQRFLELLYKKLFAWWSHDKEK
jgi:ribonuclease HII